MTNCPVHAPLSVDDAFEFSEDAICITTLDKIVVRANAAFLEMFRYGDADRALGKNLGTFWEDIDGPGNDGLLGAINAGNPWKRELAVRTGDGRGLFVRVSAHPIGGPGAPEGILLFWRDLSPQVLMEKQLIHSAQLAMLGALGFGMSHELNDPLASLLLDAEVIRDSLPKGSRWKKNRRLSEAAGSIVRNAEHMRRLLNHSNAFFGRDALVKSSTIQIRGLLEDALLFSRKRLASCGIDVRIDCPGDLHTLGNRAQLESVLHTLFENSQDAFASAGKRGGIRINGRGLADPGKLALEFRDDAGGMAPEVMPRIFDPFFTTKGDDRLGLGLSIGLRIIRKHGGALYCDPIENGSLFRIVLPRSGGS